MTQFINRAIGFLAVGLGLFLTVPPLMAHHSFAAEYDDKKPVTLKGPVTKYDWTDPHVYIYVDVADSAGNIANWALEFASPLELRKAGWSRESVKIGDMVTADGSLARDGSKQAAGKTVSIAGGKKLSAPSAEMLAPPRATGAAKPAPRWPDGHPRLGPAPGERGYWVSAGTGGLVQNGANVRMNADGLLLNIADVPKVAPFKPWAKDLYEYRQRNLLKDDPMVSCLPPSGPRQFQDTNGVQFLEQPDRQRIFVMSGGGNRNWRLIYLDARELPIGDDVNPTYFGYSDGKWEGDTLVTTVVGYNERFWFTNGGLPHTENMHLTERFTRTDFNTMKYEVTINDPGAYTQPWSAAWSLRWVANEDIPEYFCQENNNDPAHMVGVNVSR